MTQPTTSDAARRPTERHATRIFQAVYQRANREILEMLAFAPATPPKIVNRQFILYGLSGLGNVNFRRWLDQRVINRLSKYTFQGTLVPEEYTESKDADDVIFEELDDGETVMVDVVERTPDIVNGWINRKIMQVVRMFERNPICSIDDQNLFDTDHKHLSGDTTYSNIVTGLPGRAAPEGPSPAEVAAEFEMGVDRLDQNRIVSRELHFDERGLENRQYLVITRDRGTAQAFRKLHHDKMLVVGGASVENEWRGAFRHASVEKPPGAPAVPAYWIVRADRGGPRPATQIEWMFSGVKVKQRREGLQDDPDPDLIYGADAWLGTTPAFPMTIVEMRP